MKFEVETKFNIGDEVCGDIRLKNSGGALQIAKFEGKIQEIVVRCGDFADKTNHDKFAPKRQILVEYEVKDNTGVTVTINEEGLRAIKRTLDYFSTDELEEELKRRRENE